MLKKTLISISISFISLGIWAQAPTLEIMNKSAQDIDVTVEHKKPGTSVWNKLSLLIPGNATKSSLGQIDANDDLRLSIIFMSAGTRKLFNVYMADSARGKTKYLTWNPAKDPKVPLYPQTGTGISRIGAVFGGAAKTESGLSLDKNITQKEILQALPPSPAAPTVQPKPSPAPTPSVDLKAVIKINYERFHKWWENAVDMQNKGYLDYVFGKDGRIREAWLQEGFGLLTEQIPLNSLDYAAIKYDLESAIGEVLRKLGQVDKSKSQGDLETMRFEANRQIASFLSSRKR